MASSPTSTAEHSSSPGSDVAGTDEIIRQLGEYLSTIEPETIRVRREAEQAARQLIEEQLGRFSEEDLRRLYSLFNQDWFNGAPPKEPIHPRLHGDPSSGRAPVPRRRQPMDEAPLGSRAQ